MGFHLNKEGIGLRYDPQSHILFVDVMAPGELSKTVTLSRKDAIQLYRNLGVMLGPDPDA